MISRGMLGFFSSRDLTGIRNESGWNMIVGRDVIVPVINKLNPALEKINQTGLSADALLRIMNSAEGEKWNSVITGSENAVINYYWINDESITTGLTGFLGTDKINLAGKEVAGSQDLIPAIRKDRYGIGFCKLTAVADLNKQILTEGLCILPIDKNNNGTLDYTENIYSDFNQFIRGIWIGKYPKTLCSNIYATGISQPEGKESLAFLKWVLTDGQKFLYDNGYNDLLLTERQRSVEKLDETKVHSTAMSESRSPFLVLFLLFTAALIVVVVVSQVIRYAKRTGSRIAVPVQQSGKVFGESSVVIPQGLYFDKTHTWAFMEQDGIVKVGIDDFLQHITGTITRINMKKNGSKVQKGEQILSLIQNGKHLDLYAPVSGVIREHNSILESNSDLLNSSPYNEGWIYRIEPSNWQRENQLLFYAEKYRQYLSQEFTRLKDFMATVLNSGNEKYSLAILQDGGELHDGILSQMGPEVWEDFQTKYIDPSRQIWFYEMF
jgi:glycine cleavage system H lipoate-binding protein